MTTIIKSFLIASLLSSVTLFAYNPMDGVNAQTKEALTYVKNFISPQELKTWMKDGKKFQLIDVREADEWAAGTIAAPNLIKIQRGKVYTLVKKGVLKPENNYVVYCRTKHRGTLAAATLIKYFKFQNVTVLDGGIKAWIQSGGDINNSLHLGTVNITLKK